MKQKLLLLIVCLLINSLSYSQTVFSSKQSINANTGTNPYVIASGNLDADSFKDIAIGTYAGNTVEWYKNDGVGNFTLQTLVSSTLTALTGIAIADLDGNNLNDIIASSYSEDKLVWFPNNGSGGFGSEQIISSSIAGAGTLVTGLINGDSNIDIAIIAYDSGKVSWFAGNGSGGFGSEQTIDLIANSGPSDIDMKDFDGDTDLDVVVAYGDSGAIELYYNNLIPGGTATFTKDSNTVSTGNSFTWDVSIADINDDGNIDILKSDLYGDVAYYTKNVGGTFDETIIPVSSNNPATATVADFDNDTYNDLLVSNGNTTGDDLYWFESTDSGTFGSQLFIDNSQQQVYALTINDFDNDGDLDIATISYQQHDVNWFENLLETLNIDSFSNEPIKIYPNPTSSKLNFRGINESFDVEVYNIIGKLIISKNLNNGQSLDVSNLTNGVYIIKFPDFDKSYKFIKN